MKDILEATIQYIKKIRQKFNDKYREIQKLPPELQKKIFEKFKGAIHYDMIVRIPSLIIIIYYIGRKIFI